MVPGETDRGGNPPGGNNNIIPAGSYLSNVQLALYLRNITNIILSNRTFPSRNVNMNDITLFIWDHIHSQLIINNTSSSVTVTHTTPLNYRSLIVPEKLFTVLSNPDPLYGGRVSQMFLADYARLRAQATAWLILNRPGETR